MAIFDVSVRAVQRSRGHSATAGAAYAIGAKITDERTGIVHDYSRKRGVLANGLEGWHGTHAGLWQTAELKEKHPRAVTARSVPVALPHELDLRAHVSISKEISRRMRERWKVAVSWGLHAPPPGGDSRNWHSHFLWTTRRVTDDGVFGDKTRELDVKPQSSAEITWLREMIAGVINNHLAAADVDARVDHRSLRSRWLASCP